MTLWKVVSHFSQSTRSCLAYPTSDLSGCPRMGVPPLPFPELIRKVTLLDHDPNVLSCATEFLQALDPSAPTPHGASTIKALSLCTVVGWLSHIRKFVSGHNTTVPRAHVRRINMSAKRAILLLRKMVIEHEKVHIDKSSSHRNLARHLDFLASISADNSSHWSDYCEKLRTYSVNFCKRLLVVTSQQAHTPPSSLVNSELDEPSCLPCDRPCFSHLQRSVFDELSNMYPDAQLSRCQPNALWKRAFEVSGVMDVVHTVSAGCSKSLASKQSTNECEIIDATMRSFIVQLKGHLAELRCLFDLCTNPGGDIQSEDKRPVSKRKQSSDLSSPSKPARLKRRPCLGVDMDSSEEITTVFDTPKTRAASAHCRFSDSTISTGRPTRATQKSLVPKEYFTKFVGTVATPPPSPAPATQMKEVFRLDSVPPGQKRVPWSVEESIALWHGVTTHKGNRWADIWHQSFKRSGRSQVDLKDRWRVIQRNHTIRDAIARAYEAWVCDQKNHLDRLPCGALPTPVIVRSPAL